MANRKKTGTVYLVHFDTAFSHARHYLGFTEREDVDARMAEHKCGRGSKLLRAVTGAGIGWSLVRTWEGFTRSQERHLKNRKNSPGFCPVCVAAAKMKAQTVAKCRVAA